MHVFVQIRNATATCRCAIIHLPPLLAPAAAVPSTISWYYEQNGAMVALEVIVESSNGGFEALLGVVDRLRQRHGRGVFASSTPAQVNEVELFYFHVRLLQTLPTMRNNFTSSA